MAVGSISSAILAFFSGSMSGIVTGITPGLHVNLVSTVMVSSADALASMFSSMDIAIFLVAMATVHTVLDVIPSIFLGAPIEAFAVSVLPGQRLMLAGAGYEAVRLATAGAVVSAIISVIVSPLLFLVMPYLDVVLSPRMSLIIIAVTILLVLREKGWAKRIKASIAVILAGLLGYLVLIKSSMNDPLLPMLSGLFGASTLILSLGDSTSIPPQYVTENVSIPVRRQCVLVACAVFSGWIVAFLPGVGAAQAAILSTLLLPSLQPVEYLFLVGGIGTVNFMMSIITTATIGKARNGAVAAVIELIPRIDIQTAACLSASALAAAGLGAFLALGIGRMASRLMSVIPYKVSCMAVIIFVTALISFRSGPVGVLVFITAAALGILASSSGVARLHLMACLMVPVVARIH